jgi:hypothetical protein
MPDLAMKLKPDRMRIENYADLTNLPEPGRIVTILGIREIHFFDDKTHRAYWVAAWLKVPETAELFIQECNRIFAGVHFEKWEYGTKRFEAEGIKIG